MHFIERDRYLIPLSSSIYIEITPRCEPRWMTLEMRNLAMIPFSRSSTSEKTVSSRTPTQRATQKATARLTRRSR